MKRAIGVVAIVFLVAAVGSWVGRGAVTTMSPRVQQGNGRHVGQAIHVETAARAASEAVGGAWESMVVSATLKSTETVWYVIHYPPTWFSWAEPGGDGRVTIQSIEPDPVAPRRAWAKVEVAASLSLDGGETQLADAETQAGADGRGTGLSEDVNEFGVSVVWPPVVLGNVRYTVRAFVVASAQDSETEELVDIVKRIGDAIGFVPALTDRRSWVFSRLAFLDGAAEVEILHPPGWQVDASPGGIALEGAPDSEHSDQGKIRITAVLTEEVEANALGSATPADVAVLGRAASSAGSTTSDGIRVDSYRVEVSACGTLYVSASWPALPEESLDAWLYDQTAWWVLYSSYIWCHEKPEAYP